jgi:hypothetical protein
MSSRRSCVSRPAVSNCSINSRRVREIPRHSLDGPGAGWIQVSSPQEQRPYNELRGMDYSRLFLRPNTRNSLRKCFWGRDAQRVLPHDGARRAARNNAARLRLAAGCGCVGWAAIGGAHGSTALARGIVTLVTAVLGGRYETGLSGGRGCDDPFGARRAPLPPRARPGCRQEMKSGSHCRAKRNSTVAVAL